MHTSDQPPHQWYVELRFRSPTASVILHTCDEEVEAALRRMTVNMPGGGLSVTVVLVDSITDIRDPFMQRCRDGGETATKASEP